MIIMAKRAYYRSTNYNVLRIFRALQQAHENGDDFLTVSEIARRCRIHKWTVSRTLDIYMHSIVDVVQPRELEAIGLQAKLVKLRNPRLTPKQIANYLKLRKEINQ
jgi:hypothetical protein